MDNNHSKIHSADTANSILASAFGEEYYGWISLPPSDNRPLPEELKKKLVDLIIERDHYEIKQVIVKQQKKNSESE